MLDFGRYIAGPFCAALSTAVASKPIIIPKNIRFISTIPLNPRRVNVRVLFHLCEQCKSKITNVRDSFALSVPSLEGTRKKSVMTQLVEGG